MTETRNQESYELQLQHDFAQTSEYFFAKTVLGLGRGIWGNTPHEILG